MGLPLHSMNGAVRFHTEYLAHMNRRFPSIASPVICAFCITTLMGMACRGVKEGK
jgi:hypothetical protein